MSPKGTCVWIFGLQLAELLWNAMEPSGGGAQSEGVDNGRWVLLLSLLPVWRQPGSCYIVFLLQSPSVATPSHPTTVPTISSDNASHRLLPPHWFCYSDFRDWVGWALETRPSLSLSTPNTQGRTLSSLYGNTWIYTPLKFLFENYKLKPHLTVMTVSGFPTHTKNGKIISWSQNQ